jgi:hypothetical protein
MITTIEHEQDPDNHVTSSVHDESLMREEFMGEPGEEGEERPRTSGLPVRLVVMFTTYKRKRLVVMFRR